MPRSAIVSALAASAITLTVTLAGLGTIVDVALLTRHAGALTIAATAAVVTSLAVFVAALAAPPVALIAWAMRNTRGRSWDLAWALLSVAGGTAMGLFLTEAFYR